MKARSPIAATLVAIAVTALLGSCSSSKTSGSTTATQSTSASSAAPTATQPATSATTLPSSSPATPTTQPSTTATTATTAAPSSADDTTAITAAFTKFFDGLDPSVDAKIALLEHGDVLGSMITDAAQNPQFQQLTTMVNSVTVLSDADCTAAGEVSPCAAVGHDMFIGGLPAMVGLKSHAVKINGVWKVSAASWCAVVTLGGSTCPAYPKG